MLFMSLDATDHRFKPQQQRIDCSSICSAVLQSTEGSQAVAYLVVQEERFSA